MIGLAGGDRIEVVRSGVSPNGREWASPRNVAGRRGAVLRVYCNVHGIGFERVIARLNGLAGEHHLPHDMVRRIGKRG